MSDVQIEEIELKNLDHRVQRQVENAKNSIVRGNYDYASEICMNILRAHLGCLDVRKVLRRAQVARYKATAKKTSKFLSKVTSAPFSIIGNSLVKKNPEKAIEQAAQSTSNRTLKKHARKVIAGLQSGLGLTEAIKLMDDSKEFQWRLTNALQTEGNFVAP